MAKVDNSMAKVDSSNIVFHPHVQTFQSRLFQPANNQWTNSIQKLIALLETSPFIFAATLGPKVYTEDPFELKDKVNGISVYGWKPDSNRQETTPKCFFILGAQVRDERELVYYASAQGDTLLRGNFRRDPTDDKIYVVSFRRFQESVTFFALPPELMASFPTQRVELTPEETVWFNRFLEFPIDTTLGTRQEECKALAQEAFDSFKQQFSGDSILAKEALVHICDAMLNRPETRQYHGNLERAWNGVGDEVAIWGW